MLKLLTFRKVSLYLLKRVMFMTVIHFIRAELFEKKYRFLLLSIMLFLCIDISVLVPNLFISNKIQYDTVTVNLDSTC